MTTQTLFRREHDAPWVYEALGKLKRTGWLMRGIPPEEAESVKEHKEALLMLVNTLSPQLTPEEQDGLPDMLEVHDWPEIIDGDQVILEEKIGDKKALLEAKFEGEKRALQGICEQIPRGEEVMALWLRFETSDDPAAVFARQLDKYQAVEKALEYEKTHKVSVFEEFYSYSIKYITHPLLLARMEALMTKWRKG